MWHHSIKDTMHHENYITSRMALTIKRDENNNGTMAPCDNVNIRGQ